MTAVAEKQVLWRLVGKGQMDGQYGFTTAPERWKAAKVRCEYCARYNLNLDEWEADQGEPRAPTFQDLFDIKASIDQMAREGDDA